MTPYIVTQVRKTCYIANNQDLDISTLLKLVDTWTKAMDEG